ncbi:MAG: subclass B3 metallo-beta-lactamase [Acidobacteriia bacterium]|nr:subclass B3 metallo-beta-lactamase [Terriglobia bacterium]
MAFDLTQIRGGWSLMGAARVVAALVMAVAIPGPAHAQASADMRALNQLVHPFHAIGNIYYVGASDITSYLIVTPAGDILLDGGFVETAPQIEANIQTLGFKLSDVKFLLNSHAHLDHAGGIAELKRATGAPFVAMDGDVPALTAGTAFPATTPDRMIHDGDTISLGGVVMTAYLTPGHTRGCTTWTMVTQENGKQYNVVFVGSATVLPNYKLLDRPNAPATYPGIEPDYEKTFRVLKSLPCDVFLASHGSFYSLTQKRETMSKSPAQNPFIDPAGYQAYIARAEGVFQTELQRERAQPN